MNTSIFEREGCFLSKQILYEGPGSVPPYANHTVTMTVDDTKLCFCPEGLSTSNCKDKQQITLEMQWLE